MMTAGTNHRHKSSIVITAAAAILAVLLMSNSSVADDSANYEATERTSKVKNFGVGGWDYGTDCPGQELFWKFKRNDYYPTAFFRMKDGKVVKLDRGMAMFSPDCNWFWFTGYDGDVVSVFESRSGKWVSSFSGNCPAWSPDSKRIIVSGALPDNSCQLWEWSVAEREKKPILVVKDYCPCQPPGDGVGWRPVEFKANGDLVWTYSTCNKLQSGNTIMRVLTIGLPSRKVIKTENAEDYCEK